MKVSTCRVFVMSSALAMGVILVSTGRVAGADPPDPDLTGTWLGTFVSVGDPESVGEVYMRVDSQDRLSFKGQLSLNLLRFDIQGSVFADPPDPDADPPDPDADPPDPDNVVIQGNAELDAGTRVVWIDVRGKADPPDPDRPAMIVANYKIVFADGSTDAGALVLVQVIGR